ncbi:DUF5827 family protein [Salinigranum sp. GCM10025319]|uniref:DUF5827 family protein n=1 Tax=Salinigranum sp. GCM10025319 TaxID=3252687 RepID=UPI00361C4C23
MPRPKDDFDTLYPYQMYTPAEILDPEVMYTVPEIGRRLQDLAPDTPLEEETEARVIAWTIPWLVYNQDDLVINDPEGDEPGYFGVSDEAVAALEGTDEVDGEDETGEAK